MKEIEYETFLEKTCNVKSKPLFGQIDLTYRCNYNCTYCYCKGQPRQELGFSFWKDIFMQVRELGCLELTFTGGDPILHKDFKKIYACAKEMGFIIVLFTSGYNLDNDMLDFLEDNPPYIMEITLNSLKKENYEAIARKKDSFHKVMGTINEIKRRKLPLVLKCVGLKANKQEIVKIKRFTEKLLGKGKFKCDTFIVPTLDGKNKHNEHKLSASEIIEIEKSDPDMLKLHKESLEHQHSQFNPEGLYHCSSIFSLYFVDPEGILKFCQLTKKYSTDLKKTPFKKGFDRFTQILEEKFKTNSPCATCKYRDYCYRCPARAYLETGNEEAPFAYYCSLAKAYKDFNSVFNLKT